MRARYGAVPPVEANHPGCGIKVGLYRRQVEAEKNVNPGDRVKANE